MRYHDDDESKLLNAEQWQQDLLRANPPYCGWGPHEDYMTKTGESWDCRIIVPTWAEFGPWKLDDLNECAGFYFDVSRASEECKTCGGNGYHPKAQGVVNTFYSHMNQAGESWNKDITQDEVQALVDSGRLMDWTHDFVAGEGWKKKVPEYVPTAAEVNAAQSGFRSHDAINRGILTEARLKRLGLPVLCPNCEGRGETFTEPAAHVSLVLWWLHPRKGCSRGIEVTRIERGDLPAVRAFLAAAADRNAMRFAGALSLPSK
jgi:hypothetical protein